MLPFIKLLCSPARKSITCAISSGSAARPSGTEAVANTLVQLAKDGMIALREVAGGEERNAPLTAVCNSGGNEANISVAVAPGWTQFERIPAADVPE